MIDILVRKPLVTGAERIDTQLTSDMFAQAVHSPNLFEGESTTRTLHESPVFSLNGRQCKIRYSYIASRSEDSIGRANVEITTPEGRTIATNRCTFAHNPERHGAEIVIGRRFDTKEEFRGNGFGTAVALLTNELIEHTMHTQSGLKGKSAVSMLFDETETEWSSAQARQLGFKQIGNRIWVREYQG